MLCPECDAENREAARFCVSCGARLALVCPQCGTEFLLSARFCDDCGARLTARTDQPVVRIEPERVEALKRLAPKEFAERLLATRGKVPQERRVVTSLFCDIVGSTPLAATLDPEDVLQIMDGAFDVLIAPIYRYEATVARLMGDAVLAFFGAPIAHENDPERACRAAMDIVGGVQRYADRLERDRGITGFNVRVGIHTGLVVVGEVGSDLRVEYTAMGDAVNLAQRLQSAAQPGTVLITDHTYQLVAPLVETEALGPVEVKGRPEPVLVHRLRALKAQPERLWGIAGLGSPLVGRGNELVALQQALEGVQAGVGGIVTLVGEAGIGKSRLVAEVRKPVAVGAIDAGATDVGAIHELPLRELPLRRSPLGEYLPHRLPVRWVEGRCPSHGGSIPYLLWLDVLRGLLNVTASDMPSAVHEALLESVNAWCAENADHVYPHLARLLSLRVEGLPEATLGDLEGETLKRNTFSAVQCLLDGAAKECPLVVVCEDLHWADSTSVELLEAVLALTDGAPLLLICVFRPERECGCWHIKELAARSYAHRHTDVWLDPLTLKEAQTLLCNLLRMTQLQPSLRARVLPPAEGNPFYVEEITRALIDSGAIVHDEDSGTWQPSSDLSDVPMPYTLSGVLMARFDQLPEEAKKVLGMAAVIGRLFSFQLLEAIAEEEWDLDALLLTLQQEQMVRERARIPEREYIFKHELTREAAYGALLKTQRRLLHRRVARALEHLHAHRMEEQVELLAHHWQLAGEGLRAVHYLLQAGDRARRLGASLEAVSCYESALRETLALERLSADVPLAHIHECLGDVYVENLSRHDEGLQQYQSFLALAASAEDVARGERKVAVIHLMRGDLDAAQEHYERALRRLTALPPCAEASRVRCGLGNLFLYRNRLQEANEHTRASLEISQQVGDTRGLADASKGLGIIAYYRGRLQEAYQCFERALEYYRELGDLPRIAQACNNLGDGCRRLGQMDRALEHLNEGLQVARRIGAARVEAILLQTTAELFLDRGQWQEAVAYLEQAQPLAEQCGVAERIIEVHRILGQAHVSMGRLDAARHHLSAARELSREAQHFHLAPQIYIGLAYLHAAEDDIDEACRFAQLAQDCAGESPPQPLQGLLHRCRGYLCGKRGDWVKAVAHLERSLEALESADLPAEAAVTRHDLGRAYSSRGQEGDVGRAREQLLAALSAFQRIGARRYVAQIETTLEQHGIR